MNRAARDTQACNAIAALLHHQPWNRDTLTAVAAIIRGTRRRADEKPPP